MLKQNKMQENPDAYISTKTIINNSDAIASVNQFLNNLGMLADNLIIPIDEKIKIQNEIIEAVKSDLGKTDEEQKTLRQYLAKQIQNIKDLEKNISIKIKIFQRNYNL